MKRVKNIIGTTVATVALTAALSSAAIAADIKVGVVISTTGKYAFVGVPLKNGIDLAFAEANAAGAFKGGKVDLQFEDNGSVKAQAISLINRMGTRPEIKMLIGPIASSEAMATGPVAVDHKMPMFTTATSPKVLAAGPWVFKVTEIAKSYMTSMAEFTINRLKPKSCFSVTIRDNEGYIIQRDVFRDYIKAHGVNIAADETILSSDTDFTALSTKIVNAKADCLFLSTPPEQGANIIIQAKQAGMPASTTLIGNTGMGSKNYLDAGGKAVENTYLPSEFNPAGVNANAKAFIAAYEKKFGEKPLSWAAVGYTMGVVASEAIKNAGADPSRDAIRMAMGKINNLPVPLGGGSFSIGPDRLPHFGATVLQIKGGKWITP